MINEILELAKQFNAQPLCCNDDGDYNRLNCALGDADIIGMRKENFLSFVAAIICDGCKFRVKPEPKTVSVRAYWIKGVFPEKPFILRFAIDADPKMIESLLAFHDWAGDEQILTAPEV